MKFTSDIDIDLGDREKILQIIKHIPASMRNVNPIRKHPTGIHVTDIPFDPVNQMSSLHYEEAERRGYFKLDLLNVHVYNQVRDENHLTELMREPDWTMLNHRNIVEQLIHLGNQYDTILKMPEPINSIPRLAMFLAVIRPAKRHLIGKTWSEINQSVWDKDMNGYTFKRSHSCAYAMLVVVHMNLIKENESKIT